MTAPPRLAGRVVVVTGGGRGIGRALAVSCAGQGARVAVVARTLTQLEETVRSVKREGGEAIAVTADITDPSELTAMVDTVTSAFGRLDVLVNNAGIMRFGKLEDMTREDIAEVMNVNVVGTFMTTKAVIPTMRRQDGGKIINIASTFGLKPARGHAAYCASKAAVIHFTRVAALELARDGIQVNAIAPGYVETDMTAEALEDESIRERINRRIPAQRVAQPGELGPLVTFLASAESDYMTGETVAFDGGFHL